LASRVDGVLIGEPETLIEGVCSLEEPVKGHLSFLKETNSPRARQVFASPPVVCILVSDSVNKSLLAPQGNFILVKDPLAAIVATLPIFHPEEEVVWEISQRAEIHPTASIEERVSVGAFSVIGPRVKIAQHSVIHPNVIIYRDVSVGKGAVIHSGAVIREGVQIGEGALIQNGAVIGADGFGFFSESDAAGKVAVKKVPQVGTVVLGPHTEIGANSCVDRATLGTTRIGASTKLDNLVQIGHNTKIGAGTIICGQAGIAGSTKIGNGVVIGGGAGVRDHVTIADRTRLAARAGVVADITDGGDYGGYPAVRLFAWRRQLKAIADLPSLMEEWRAKKHGGETTSPSTDRKQEAIKDE